MLETLDYTIRIGSTPTFLYFDLYLYSAYAAHYVYFIIINTKSHLPLHNKVHALFKIYGNNNNQIGQRSSRLNYDTRTDKTYNLSMLIVQTQYPSGHLPS